MPRMEWGKKRMWDERLTEEEEEATREEEKKEQEQEQEQKVKAFCKAESYS